MGLAPSAEVQEKELLRWRGAERLEKILFEAGERIEYVRLLCLTLFPSARRWRLEGLVWLERNTFFGHSPPPFFARLCVSFRRELVA